MTDAAFCILIVEDGNEYLENLQAFLPGFHYLQAHAAAPALQLLETNRIDLMFLDMRFDRCERSQLLGSPQELLDVFTLTDKETWTFIENNQGLYIYRAVRAAGFSTLPILISYDFSHELGRWQTISKEDPNVGWIPDATTPDLIQQMIRGLILKG